MELNTSGIDSNTNSWQYTSPVEKAKIEQGELREKIAKLDYEYDMTGFNHQWGVCPNPSWWLDKADQILDLFPEWAKANGYVKLADDQSLPENPHHKTCVEYEKEHKDKRAYGHLPGCLIYSDAQKDMVGWQKVILEKE